MVKAVNITQLPKLSTSDESMGVCTYASGVRVAMVMLSVCSVQLLSHMGQCVTILKVWKTKFGFTICKDLNIPSC